MECVFFPIGFFDLHFPALLQDSTESGTTTLQDEHDNTITDADDRHDEQKARAR
jgi:hypothetical protein